MKSLKSLCGDLFMSNIQNIRQSNFGSCKASEDKQSSELKLKWLFQQHLDWTQSKAILSIARDVMVIKNERDGLLLYRTATEWNNK